MRATLVDAAEIERFIYDRLSKHAWFRAVIYVTVETYPDEVFATVWLGQHLDEEIRQFTSEIESELRELGIPCTILLKTEKDLKHGITWKMQIEKEEFLYRAYRVDPVADEDWVFVFAVYRGEKTYRFRVSMTRTLASMLRARGLLDDRKILDVYASEIRERLEDGVVETDKLHELMLSSRDLPRFTV